MSVLPLQGLMMIMFHVFDVPALPGGDPRIQFLAGQNEEEKNMEETSQINRIALYGFHPFAIGSGTEVGDETNSDEQTPGPSKCSAFKSRPV